MSTRIYGRLWQPIILPLGFGSYLKWPIIVMTLFFIFSISVKPCMRPTHWQNGYSNTFFLSYFSRSCLLLQDFLRLTLATLTMITTIWRKKLLLWNQLKWEVIPFTHPTWIGVDWLFSESFLLFYLFSSMPASIR